MSENYHVQYRLMNSYGDKLKSNLDKWETALSDVKGKVDTLVASDSISGATADRMHQYFIDIHGGTLDSLQTLLETLQAMWDLYFSTYKQGIDTFVDAKISTSHVKSKQDTMNRYCGDGEDIDRDVAKILSKISDIYSPCCVRVTTDSSIYDSISTGIDQLCTAIDAHETGTQSTVQDTVAQVAEYIRGTIRDNINQNAMYKRNYSAAGNGLNYANMMAATESLKGFLTENQDDIQAARTAVEVYAVELKEYDIEVAERKKREAEAQAAKTGVIIVSVALTVGVTLATGGTGTAFVVASIAAGGVTGAMESGVDEWGKQYVANGSENLDWDKIGKNALIGGIKGAVVSGVSAGVGSGFDKLGDVAVVSSWTNSTKPVLKHGSKLGLKVLEGQVTDVSNGAIGRFIDGGTKNWVENGEGFSFDMNRALHDATDSTKIKKDMIESLVDSTVTYGVETKIKSDWDIKEIDKDTKLTVLMLEESAVVGSITKTTSGIAKRGVSTFAEDLMNGVDVGDAMLDATKTAFDGEEIYKDALEGAGDGFAKPFTEKHKAELEEKRKAELAEKQYADEVDKNIREKGIANSDSEIKIIEEMYAKGDLDVEEGELKRRRLYSNSGNTAAERKILDDMRANGELTDDDSYYSSPREETTPQRAPTMREAFDDPDLFKKYQQGDISYSENEYGKSAFGSLKITENPDRNEYAQRTAGGDERREDDHGGHLIAASQGGSGEKENLAAQNGDLNTRSYRAREIAETKALEDGAKVFKSVETYSGDGGERPSAFMGYTITEYADGRRELETFSYTNESSSTLAQWESELDGMSYDSDAPNAMMDEHYQEIHRIAEEEGY